MGHRSTKWHAGRVTRWIPGEAAVAAACGLDPDACLVFHAAAVPGRPAGWPPWLPAAVRERLVRAGIVAPWDHQVAAADAAHSGWHVVLATGTGSGKTLAYLMPVLAATLARPAAAAGESGRRIRSGELPGLLSDPFTVEEPGTALYLAPTKALAHDQWRAVGELGGPDWRPATLDGDTELAARAWVRDYATYVLTNPDLLHRTLLPQHRRWSRLLRGLSFVVVDEVHRYRGVFGAQVAAVLRRLRRVAAHHGADPVFVLTGATLTEPAGLARALLGVEPDTVTVVSDDASPRPARHLLLTPACEDPDREAAALLARLAAAGRRTLAFVQSRQAAERVASRAQAEAGSGVRIEAYRAGYLADDRRRIEQGLRSGAITGVASTNALELGVDVVGLDAVVLSGFPGSRAAFWQQAGRAGRRGRDALVVLVTGRHPLDQYLRQHPSALLDQPVEATVLHPDNPYVLGPHLAAAAQELPLTDADARFFGPAMAGIARKLEGTRVLRRRPAGWYATATERLVDGIDLRAAGAGAVDIVEASTGRVLGAADAQAADLALHEGAVYVHQGESYLCERLDHELGEAVVRLGQPGYSTQARQRTEIRLLEQSAARALGEGLVAFGGVEVRSRVTGYLRRDLATGTVWDETPLELPERVLRTEATWWTIDPALVPDQVNPHQVLAGAHAAEHACRNLLPVFAPCDRWDVSGSAHPNHPDTGRITVAVHDLAPGGTGFAERAFTVAEDWLRAVHDQLAGCDCARGCPACVVSPTCGSSQPLDKAVAALLLARICG